MNTSLSARTTARPLWAQFTLVMHIIFVLGWLIAGLWQGPRYDPLAHSISDMYAQTAPAANIVITLFTLCGLSLLLFVRYSLWPTFRAAGRRAGLGCSLLALSIFGLGDLLTPFERLACRLADPGCTPSLQLANTGGALDAALSTAGVLALIGAGFVLATAMARLTTWQRWGGPTRLWSVLVGGLFVLTGITGDVGFSGLFERLVAFVGAAGIVALAAQSLTLTQLRRVSGQPR